MGFASGNISFQRFAITGPFVEHADDAFIARLQKRGISKSATLADETQIGWIGPRHVLDETIEPAAVAFGSFAFLAVRLDRLRAPAGVIKAYVRLEEQALLEAGGREFLSKGEKRKARESAIDRAEKEARNGDFRRMGAYPVLIDLAHRVVYFGNTGSGVADKFIGLFRDTFGAPLEPLGPEAVAQRILKAAKNPRALENLNPLRLVKSPDGGDGAAVELDLAFLGRELLTWLWFRTEQDDRQLRVQEGDEIAVLIEKSLRLKCCFGVSGTTTIAADSPATLPEARAALRSGKLPIKAGLILGSRVGEFRLTFDGPKFSVSGLTLPEGERLPTLAARIEQRFEQMTDVAAILDALFELFLQERVSREWNATQRLMTAWANGEIAAGSRAAISA